MSSKQSEEITIYDLAKQLKISAATVSRALNDNPLISKKTRKKVFELADKLSYRQNDLARNLRKKTTQTIGVIIHELNSPFITSVLSGIEQIVAQANYNIIIAHSNEQNLTEISNVRNLFNKRVDGLIASLAYNTINISHYDCFFQKGIPVVFFDRVKKDGPGIKIIIDNERAGFDGTNHLIKQGCRNIMHVTGSLNQNVYADRLRGYQKALQFNGLSFQPENLIVNELGEKDGEDFACQIVNMKNRPDGIFITSDSCAAVCVQKLKEAGISIPGDIAIVGFNNDLMSRVVEPKLTTIKYDGKEIGRVAATNLMEQLKDNSKNPKEFTTVLKHELVVRNSSLKRIET